MVSALFKAFLAIAVAYCEANVAELSVAFDDRCHAGAPCDVGSPRIATSDRTSVRVRAHLNWRGDAASGRSARVPAFRIRVSILSARAGAGGDSGEYAGYIGRIDAPLAIDSEANPLSRRRAIGRRTIRGRVIETMTAVRVARWLRTGARRVPRRSQ